MNREEQIRQVAAYEDAYRRKVAGKITRDHPDVSLIEDLFITGAEWADKTIVDNICEWLNNNLTEENYLEFDED